MPAASRIHSGTPKPKSNAVHQVGDYLFHPAKNLLRGPGGEEVRLRNREKELLEFLCNASGKPVHRSELLNKVWGYVPTVETQTLENHVYLLRRKINHHRVRNRLLIRKKNCYRLAS